MTLPVATPVTEYHIPDDVRSWRTSHFLTYFSREWRKQGGPGLRLPNEAWAGFGSLVSKFRRETGISNLHYKEFIDDVLTEFQKRDMPICLGAIVSPKVYKMVFALKQRSKEFDFEELQKEALSQLKA